MKTILRLALTTLCVLSLAAGCGPAARPSAAVTPHAAPSATPRADGLTAAQVATLSSLEMVDDYPLYTMRYSGAYAEGESTGEDVATTGGQRLVPASHWPVGGAVRRLGAVSAGEGAGGVGGAVRRLGAASAKEGEHMAGDDAPWGCSLFAALGDPDNLLYGRNFDWEYSPALLLFTDPPDGYGLVSMVDTAFFGFTAEEVMSLSDLPLAQRHRLLYTPWLPFDGLNEAGLAVGMAAVPPGHMQVDPNERTIGSLHAIREMLDHSASVDEAVAVLRDHNIDMGDGPPIHYLIADSSGRAALAEFYQGELVVFRNSTPWLQATNFLRAAASGSAAGHCRRYDRMAGRLAQARGRLSTEEAMRLLAEVAQLNTQWSVVYGVSSGCLDVVMGREAGSVHSFCLPAAQE